MDVQKIQQQLDQVEFVRLPMKGLHKNFTPWRWGISPSQSYKIGVKLRRHSRFNVFESKLISIKRWNSVTPSGVVLPEGVFYSISRMEKFIPRPKPSFKNIRYFIVMLPYGNVHAAIDNDEDNPINEEWVFEFMEDGRTRLQHLIDADRQRPIKDWYQKCNEWIESHEKMRFIHITNKYKDKYVKMYNDYLQSD